MEKIRKVRVNTKQQVITFLSQIDKNGTGDWSSVNKIQALFVVSDYVDILEALDIAVSKNISVFEIRKMFKEGTLGDFVRSGKDEK